MVKKIMFLRIGIVWKYSEIWESFGSLLKIGVVWEVHKNWSKSEVI